MKKRMTAILLTSITLLLASCAAQEPAPLETSSSPLPTVSAEPSAGSAEPAPSISAQTDAELFLSREPAAAQVGRYLTENGASVTAEDGDLLLERLVLLQMDIAGQLNVRIWDKAYMSALNDTMGGIFNPSKIDDIEDNDVKAAFNEAADALITVVRYEETPLFEMNWSRIEALGTTLSDEAAAMVLYNSRLQGNYYAGDPLNFDALAADIAAVEEQLTALDGGFVGWELRKVFNYQLSLLIAGPEGSFEGEYTDKNSAYNKRLEQYAGQYGGRFADICRDLYALENEDSQTVTDYLYDALIFPPNYPLTADITITEENGAWLSLPVVYGENYDLTEKLNEIIHETALSLIKEGRTDQTLSTYVTVSGDFMSVVFACSYLDEEGQYYYSETGLVLELTTGNPVTLDTLVGAPFDSYKDALLKVMRGYNIPARLEPTFSFYLTDNGMAISLPSEDSGWPDYYIVTFNGLRSFMDISQLY